MNRADSHPLIPDGFDDWPAPYGDLAALRRFLRNPDRPEPSMLDRLAAACECHLEAAVHPAAGLDPLHVVLGFPSTVGGLRILLRDAWLLDAHRLIGGGYRELHSAVIQFKAHPWPTWEKARVCPPLHPTEHHPWDAPLFYAFQAAGGSVPVSDEHYRMLLLSAPKKSGEKFVLGELWHAYGSITPGA